MAIVIVTDRQGTELEYPDLHAVTDKVGIPITSLRSRISDGMNWNGYSFRYKEGQPIRTRRRKSIEVTYEDGTKHIFKSAKEAAETLGIGLSTIRIHIRDNKPLRGLSFSIEGGFMTNHKRKKIIAFGPGSFIIFRDINEAASRFLTSETTIRRFIYNGKTFKGFGFDYYLEAYDD